MNGVGNLSITNTNNPANSDVTVVFSPSLNVETYNYEIYQDNKIATTSFPLNKETTINFTETGVYQIKINANLLDGTSQSITSGYYIIDKESPEIIVKNENLEIKENVKDTINQNVTAKDNFDGNMTNQVKTNIDSLDLKTNKDQKLVYTVIDRAGNETTKEINIKIINNDYLFMFQAVFIILFFIVSLMIIRVQRALKLEKRIEPYTLKPIENNKPSLSEKLIKEYQRMLDKITKNFDKSEIAKKYSKKLDKYTPVTKLHTSGLEIFAGKFITAFIFVIIALVIQGLKLKLLASYEITLIFTFGFFVLDILYFIKYKIFRWKVESDFIAAITIMNNAFKSGRSITQAIDIVNHELKGIVGEEFGRMSIELLYGLGIDVVFKRFAKRINLEEANYLTASLTILNKTGGDIIKVFDSIERNMFDKRKLRLELASLTSGSRIVVAVLLGMPFFFVLVINIINPEYFIPFFTTSIGIILLIFMLIYYIIFVVVVRKIMKVVI